MVPLVEFELTDSVWVGVMTVPEHPDPVQVITPSTTCTWSETLAVEPPMSLTVTPTVYVPWAA